LPVGKVPKLVRSAAFSNETLLPLSFAMPEPALAVQILVPSKPSGRLPVIGPT
jgi:hypothetical protein